MPFFREVKNVYEFFLTSLSWFWCLNFLNVRLMQREKKERKRESREKENVCVKESERVNKREKFYKRYITMENIN